MHAQESKLPIVQAKQAPANQETLLVGLLVDGTEVSVLDVIQSADEFLVPIDEIFQYINANYQLTNEYLSVTVPSGNSDIDIVDTYLINGKTWLSLSTLNESLLLNAKFNQSKYAVEMSPPWNEERAKTDSKKSNDVEIDYGPSKFSLRQFRFIQEFNKSENSDLTKTSNFLSSGAAYGGSWRVELDKNQGQDWQTDEYFWFKRQDRSQWLLGKQTISPSTIAPAATITGVQYFHSNQDLPYDAYNDVSQSNFFNELGNSIQRIRGVAQPGTIAQLFISGDLRAEIFVRLDGSYDFGEVQLVSSSFNEIEIVILDSVNRSVIERQNKTSANSDYILDDNQQVTSFSFGKKGDLLDPNYEDVGEAGSFLYRYGVTDKTTLEAGYLSDDEDTATVGIATSLGKNYTALLRIAERNEAQAKQLELNGYGKKWRLATYVRQQDTAFNDLSTRVDDVQDSSSFASSNFYYNYSKYLRLELIGRYRDDGRAEDVKFLKPGFFYSPTHNLTIGTRPESDGRYRSEINYRPSRRSRWRLTHRDTEQNARFDWQHTDNTNVYYSYRRFENDLSDSSSFNRRRDTENAVGFYWRPDQYEAYKYLRAEATNSNQFGWGGFVEYRTPLHPGIYLDLQVREGGSSFGDGTSGLARVSFDYAYSGGRFLPGRNSSSYNTRGTISGYLKSGTDNCNIKQVSVLLNGISFVAPVQGCSYRVDSVPPGVYTVRLATEYLPIELIPDSSQYTAVVAPSAVTKIDFDLQAEYSAAGRVFDENGKYLEGVLLKVLDAQSELVSQAYTDQFGLFRVDGLVNGQYLLQAFSLDGKLLANREFLIESDFIFGLDLIAP